MIRVGTYAFRRCACPGCMTDIYAPVHIDDPRCVPHGGPGYFEEVEVDEWGEPISPDAAAADSSPAAVRLPSLECE